MKNKVLIITLIILLSIIVIGLITLLYLVISGNYRFHIGLNKEKTREEVIYNESYELEKIETELIAMTGYIEQGEYAEAVASIEKTKYILEHLQEKEKLSLINIF